MVLVLHRKRCRLESSSCLLPRGTPMTQSHFLGGLPDCSYHRSSFCMALNCPWDHVTNSACPVKCVAPHTLLMYRGFACRVRAYSTQVGRHQRLCSLIAVLFEHLQALAV